jgi:hypothetical protein
VSLTVTNSNSQTTTVTKQVMVAAVRGSLTYPTAGETNVNTAIPFSWAGRRCPAVVAKD